MTKVAFTKKCGRISSNCAYSGEIGLFVNFGDYNYFEPTF